MLLPIIFVVPKILFAVDTEAERAIALQAALSDVDNALLTFLAMTKAKGLVH